MVDHAFEASRIAFFPEPRSSSKFNHIIISIIAETLKVLEALKAHDKETLM
jgi:hypothetical protein